MKLVQLEYFKTACKYGNITKAGDELHVSQPAISVAIKDLETEFGLALFYRLNKGLVLTKEGEIFLTQATELLEHADHISQVMYDLADNRNLIRLGIPPMIGTFLFPKLYKGFKEKFPEVKMKTQESGAKNLLELLKKGMLDIAIVPSNDLSLKKYHMLHIAKVETVFCVSKNHPLASHKTVTIPLIHKEPLVMFSGGFYQNENIRTMYEKYDLEPNIIHYSSQLNTIQEFIANDIAAGFMFKNIADTVPDIIGISLEEPIEIQISIIWENNHYMFSDTKKFIEYTKKFFEKR